MTPHLSRKWLLASLVVLLIAAPLVHGQGFQTGTLSAVAKDPTGAALPGVTVTVTSEERGTERTGVTDTSGTARFPILPAGFYRVEGTLSGFNSATRQHNKVDTDKTTQVDISMTLAATTETITVTGQQPVIDKTNVAANTHVSTKEFEKAPVARSYLTLIDFAPGVIDQPGNANAGNPQVHGSTNAGNVYLFDGVDATDTVTGTFSANLNFEAIQEVAITTAGMSAEYGRATGGMFNVITKSGTNRFEGSLKSIQTNDSWNAQNKTHNEVTGAPLARTRVDHNVYRYSGTLGGPVWRDRVWFFAAYEKSTTSGQPNTTAISGEEYTQVLESKSPNYRLTAQITPTQTIWGKYDADPIDGFVNQYWASFGFGTGEVPALTLQNQGGNRKTAQYSAIFGERVTAEVLYGESKAHIGVSPYRLSSLNDGAAHIDLRDGFAYNGGAFDGYVDRPRKQAVAAASYYTAIGGNSHNFKAGVDWQDLKSSNLFRFPSDQLFFDNAFDYKTRQFEPFIRQDYVPAEPSTSDGKLTSIYVRDKFDLNRRLFMELGLRFEKESSKNDVGETVFDTSALAPRLQASYDLLGNGNTILSGTVGRFYQSIVLSLSDTFANVPQQTNYNQYIWDPATQQYVFSSFVGGGANVNQPNLGLDAEYVDEITIGAQQQIGPAVGVGIRGIYRKWHDVVDDVLSFDSSNNLTTTFVNLPEASRTYKGVELSFEKRFSHNWNLLANYTYSQTRGNQFVQLGSRLANFDGLNCTTSVDPSLGTIPCDQANSPDRNFGHPSWDLPHLFNLLGTYSFNLGPVALTAGSAGIYSSGISFSKTRTLSVLNSAGAPSGQTLTYLYDGQGTDRDPNWWRVDISLDATYRIFGIDIGAKGEMFNAFDRQTPVVPSNTAWCGTTTTAACQTAISRFGTHTTRGAFMVPRSFRLTALVRF